MTIKEARDFFISMGCSSFHMARENPDKYTQYGALNISESLERQWTTESFDEACETVLSGQRTNSLWSRHSECEKFMPALKSKDYFTKMLALTRYVAEKETDGNRVIVAETINGRRDAKFREGLIYGAYDCDMAKEAAEFARLALWLSINAEESARAQNSLKKTQAIAKELNLNL